MKVSKGTVKYDVIDEKKYNDIRLYIFLRIVLLYSVLISTFFYQRPGYLAPVIVYKNYTVIFFTFLLTTTFVLLYEKIKKIRYFLVSQIIYDVLFTTVLFSYTWLYDSIYTVFYLFNIISAAILFQRRGGVLTAILCSLMYGFVTWSTHEQIPGPVSDKFFSLFTTFTAFVTISLLIGQLIEELGWSRQKISKLKQVNEEIIEFLDSGLIIIDENENIQKINRTVQALFKITNPQVLSKKNIFEVFPDLYPLMKNEIKEVVISGETKRLLINKVELPEKNINRLYLVLIKDLSEVLNLEEKIRRQERLAGIGRLAAGIAHEIRNPLASVMGASQMLSEAVNDDEERKKLSSIIIRESERVDRLVEQLLKFSKPSVVEKKDVYLNNLIKNCIESIKARSDFSELNVEFDIYIENGLVLKASEDQIAEVVSNLVINAMQAFSLQDNNKFKKLKIECLKDKDSIAVIVADNGPGIPREFKTRIFDPFFTTKYAGTGLGLAHVYKIIRDHNGSVDVETEEGKGTCFKIRLPA